MSKILLTGMTAAQTHESNKKTGLTVAGAMATCLREAGHTIEVRPHPLGENLAGYDKVFVGLGPLKGIGCGYAYGAVDAILRTIDHDHERLCLYLDDTGTGKIGSEIRTITGSEWQYTKPFFSYRKDYTKLVDDKTTLDQHLQIIHMLHGEWNWYPPVLVPSWTFDLGFAASQKICNEAAYNTVSFDPSVLFGRELTRYEEDYPYWATAHDPKNCAGMGHRAWPVEFVPRTSWDVLERATGCLVPGAAWSPELLLAVQAGIPVACDWRTLGPEFGPPFEALPANIEIMTEGQRDELAHQQADVMLSEQTTMTGVTKVLEGLL